MGFSRRYRTTQFRISAHDLQIERGRYINLPRDERVCTWCKTTLGLNVVEDEKHTLFDCDLYSKLRNKLIDNLNKYSTEDHTRMSSTQAEQKSIITHSNLKVNLMHILSPYCSKPDNSSLSNTNIFKSPPKPNSPTENERRTRLINSICTYLMKSSQERKKLLDSARDLNHATSSVNANTLVVNLN